MKTLVIGFYPPECDELKELCIDLKDTYCNLVIRDEVSPPLVTIEAFEIKGEPVKKWWFDSNVDQIKSFILTNIDPSNYEDGDSVCVGGEKYVARHLFGDPCEKYKELRFNTQAELDAYTLGLQYANGFSSVIPLEQADDIDLEEFKDSNPRQFEDLIAKYPELAF